MATEPSQGEDVIINVDEEWYRIPLADMAGYRVDPSALGLDVAGDEVSGFAFEPPRSPDPGALSAGMPSPEGGFTWHKHNPNVDFSVGDLMSPTPPVRRGSAFFPGGS